MTEEERKLDDESTSIQPFIIGSLIIIAIWLISILISIYLSGSDNERAALFGDSFGGINSLFSGLAFAGIIYTILLQRKELKLQRQELRETREELRRSADAQERSEGIMKMTAEINALSQILVYYQTAYNSSSQVQKGERGRYVKKMNEVKGKIDSIIEEIHKESEY